MDILSLIKRYRVQLSLLLICLASLTLFYPSLNYYFFQDDWLHFNISRAENVNDILNFFKFRQDIIGWRPIPKQVFFFLIQTIFKMSPVVAHLVIFAFFMGTILFIFSLTKLVLKDPKAGLIASFLYSTAAFHFISLSWISAGENIIGAFFFIAATYFFYLFFDRKKFVFYVLSNLFFIMSLSSTEFAMTWPLFITFIWLILKPKVLFKKYLTIFKYMIPSILLIIVYLILRFIIFPLPARADYRITVDFQIFNTLSWYILWLFNLPEVLKYNFLLSSLSFTKDPTFIEPFQQYKTSLLILVSIAILSLSIFLLTNFRKILLLATLAISTFIISLFPVLFLPTHTFPYYLSIPSVSIFIFFSYLIAKSLKKSSSYLLPTVLFLASWFLASFLTLSFTKKTHWVTGEENISRVAVNLAKSKYPALPKDSTIVLYPSTQMIKQALMDQEAIKEIYEDPTLKTIYVSGVNDIENEQNNVYILKLDPIL